MFFSVLKKKYGVDKSYEGVEVVTSTACNLCDVDRRIESAKTAIVKRCRNIVESGQNPGLQWRAPVNRML
jgi:hypothetical protein